MRFKTGADIFKQAYEKISSMKSKNAYDKPGDVRISAENGTVKLYVSNIRMILKVEIQAEVKEEGTAWVGMKDLGTLTILSGDLSFEFDDKMLKVTEGKRKVFINLKEKDDDCNFYDEAIKTKSKPYLEFSEQWMMDTLMHLQAFIHENVTNDTLSCFTIQTEYNRVEAMNSSLICARRLEKGSIKKDGHIRIRSCSIPVLKKLMKGKKGNISIYNKNLWVVLKGDGYDLAVSSMTGKSYDSPKDFSLGLDKEFTISCYDMKLDLMAVSNVCREGQDIASIYTDKDEVVLYAKRRDGTAFLSTIKSSKMDDDTYTLTSFSVPFLTRIFNCVDVEDCSVSMKTENHGYTSPLYVKGDEYEFLCMPIKRNSEEILEEILNKI